MKGLIATALVWAILLGQGRAEWTNFPLPETPTETYRIHAALSELIQSLAERTWAIEYSSTSNLLVMTNLVLDTSNPVSQVVGNWTNWSYPFKTNYLTNVVQAGSAVAAMRILDGFLHGNGGLPYLPNQFASTSAFRSASTALSRPSTTSWCYYSSSGCWYPTTNYVTDFPVYFLGTAAGLSEQEERSLVEETGYGLIQAWTTSYSVVTSMVPGYAVGLNCVGFTNRYAKVSTNAPVTQQHLLPLIPERAFPTQGVTLGSFVYGPMGPSNNALAYYPKFVELSGSVDSNYNGRLDFEGLVEDESGFWDGWYYPSYGNGGSYRVYLYNDAAVFAPDSEVVTWSVNTEPNFGSSLYSLNNGIGENRPEIYSEAGFLYPIGTPPLGTNLFLTVPGLGTNWFVHVGWQMQKLSRMQWGGIQIPFSNYAPPAVVARTGSTNWTDFVPFTATNILFRQLRAPSVIDRVSNYLAVVPALYTNALTLAFDSAGTTPALTSFVVEVAFTGQLTEAVQFGTSPNPIDGTGQTLTMGETNWARHFGDRIDLVWTNPTALYGNFYDVNIGSGYRPGLPLYPEAVNARWACLKSFRFTQSRNGIRQKYSAMVSVTNAASDVTGLEDAARGAMKAQFAALSPVYTNVAIHTFAPSEANEENVLRQYTKQEGPSCEDAGDDCYAYIATAGVSLERLLPVLGVRTNLMPVRLVYGFQLAGDSVQRECDGSVSQQCYNTWWDGGSAGKFVEYASGPALPYLTNGQWYAVLDEPTTFNQDVPDMGDCVEEDDYDEGWSTVVSSTPCGDTPDPLCLQFWRSTFSRSYGRRAQSTFVLSVVDWDFQHED